MSDAKCSEAPRYTGVSHPTVNGDFLLLMSDWVKLHRKIQDSEWWLSERFTKSQAWIDLIMLAGHKPKTLFVRGNEVKLKRGELIHSLDTLAHRWQWNKRTVQTFLNTLSNRQMIHRRKTSFCTVTTVLNYNEYQDTALQSAPQTALQSTRRLHYNKKDKKDKNSFSTPLLQAAPAEKEPYTADTLIADKKRHVQIIGLFARAKGITDSRAPNFWSSYIARNARAAKLLEPYETRRLIEVMKYLRDNADHKWTLETIGKYIDDDLATIGKTKEDTEIELSSEIQELQEKYLNQQP